MENENNMPPRAIRDIIYSLHVTKSAGHKEKIEFLRIRFGKCKDHGLDCLEDSTTMRCPICGDMTKFMENIAKSCQVPLHRLLPDA